MTHIAVRYSGALSITQQRTDPAVLLLGFRPFGVAGNSRWRRFGAEMSFERLLDEGDLARTRSRHSLELVRAESWH